MQQVNDPKHSANTTKDSEEETEGRTPLKQTTTERICGKSLEKTQVITRQLCEQK